MFLIASNTFTSSVISVLPIFLMSALSPVCRTFECFCLNKTQIVLSLERLDIYADQRMRDYIMYSLSPSHEPKITGSIEKNRINLFKDTLLGLFPNLESILVF